MPDRLQACAVGAALKRGREARRDDHRAVFGFGEAVKDDSLRVGREGDDGGGLADRWRDHDGIVKAVTCLAELGMCHDVQVVNGEHEGAGCCEWCDIGRCVQEGGAVTVQECWQDRLFPKDAE